MRMIINAVSKWGGLASLALMVASPAIAQGGAPQAAGNPRLQRHWDPAFEVPLPKGEASDDPNRQERCWTQKALDSYVAEGRLWIESIYGLPYGYAGDHCLKDQLARINTALNRSYKTILQSLDSTERKRVIHYERVWISEGNEYCNVHDGITYLMLGSFVCLMNMTNDRIKWMESFRSGRDGD